ncbi:MAG: histidine kinase [Clostridia bacterium]|nr:histidine kinase [Clostridia bacterium]
MTSEMYVTIDILSIIVLSITLAACIMDAAKSKRKMSYFVIMLIGEIVYLTFHALQMWAEGQLLITPDRAETLYVVFRSVSNIAYFAMVVFFVQFVLEYIPNKEKISKWVTLSVHAVCGLYMLVWLIVPFCKPLALLFFRIGSNGVRYEEAFAIAQIGAYYVVLVLIFLLLKNRFEIKKSNLFAFLSFLLVPIVASAIRFFSPEANYMATATFVSFILMYCFLHLQKSDEIMERELLIANNRLNILQNQIRPHFLYNTLNSIYVLCGKDPKSAQSAIGDFAEYMRVNLETLEKDSTIPLERELDYVDHYLNLEKMRFNESLEVEYDTDFTDIEIPPMTIQILAENAVKHGIEKKEGGGKISIRSRRTGGSDFIVVEDNGAGFDVDGYYKDHAGHVGIENARERLRQLCGASLVLESEIGVGTTVTIIIPRNDKEENS